MNIKVKCVTVLSLLILSMYILNGCGFNKQIIDTNYSFNEAIIENIGTVKVSKWDDYDESDMIQVIDDEGNVYLTHSSNVILIHK